MDVLLRHPDIYARDYNCSAYDIESIPLEQRRHEWIGLGFMALALIYEVLYVPCMLSLWEKLTTQKQPLHAIQFSIGLLDMVTMVANGLITGYFGFIGAVFCSSPLAIYIFGVIGLAGWCAKSSLEVLLAFYRCCQLGSEQLANALFSEHLRFWLAIPTIYGLAYGIWTRPIIFHASFMTWFFNPHVGYVEDVENKYENFAHSVHNHVILLSLIALYLAYFAITILKVGDFKKLSSAQKMMLLHVFLLSVVTVIAAFVYVYMNYFPVGKTIILLGQLCWLNAHGMPAIIYLTSGNGEEKKNKSA